MKDENVSPCRYTGIMRGNPCSDTHHCRPISTVSIPPWAEQHSECQWYGRNYRQAWGHHDHEQYMYEIDNSQEWDTPSDESITEEVVDVPHEAKNVGDVHFRHTHGQDKHCRAGPVVKRDRGRPATHQDCKNLMQHHTERQRIWPVRGRQYFSDDSSSSPGEISNQEFW